MLKVKEKVTSFWQNHDLEKFDPYTHIVTYPLGQFNTYIVSTLNTQLVHCIKNIHNKYQTFIVSTSHTQSLSYTYSQYFTN